MSRYDNLARHLAEAGVNELILSFADIEGLVGPLPPSAERPQFWANTRSTQPRPQRDACRAAGYDAFLLAGLRKVRFVRVGPGQSGTQIKRGARLPVYAKPPLTTEALVAGGFERSNCWKIADDGRLALEKPLQVTPGVYVFVKGGKALYAGIASSGFRNRLGFYIRPGRTQHTSQRLNAKLLQELAAGGVIEVYTASPPSMIWNGWDIEVGAGLEVALIRKFDVPWNVRGV